MRAIVTAMDTLDSSPGRPIDGLLREALAASPAVAGDVVRMELRADGTWLYCNVDSVLEDGKLLCSVIEAQSWPYLGADGLLPGRTYPVSPDRVLSIVRRANA